MTDIYAFQTALETLGYKTFYGKKLDTVKQAILWNTVGHKIYGSMSGKTDLQTERIQVTCFALSGSALIKMVNDVETLLAYYNSSFTSIPLDSKVDRFDIPTSTYYSYQDYYVTFNK